MLTYFQTLEISDDEVTKFINDLQCFLNNVKSYYPGVLIGITVNSMMYSK